jgi:hypothetical protein
MICKIILKLDVGIGLLSKDTKSDVSETKHAIFKILSEKSDFESSDELQIPHKWSPSWDNLELIRGFNSGHSPIFLKPNIFWRQI